MKKTLLSVLLLLRIVMCQVAIAADTTMIPASPMIVAKSEQPNNVYTDNSQVIRLTPAQPEFILKLPANPTTGYTWFTKSYDRNLLILKKQKYLPPELMMPGKGGSTQWQFQAAPNAFNAAYITTIELVYARPWELNRTAVKPLVFTVAIVPGAD